MKDLLHLVDQIVPFHMSHNAEPEAVDLLLEVERLDDLSQHVDEKNYARTCLYLASCCSYLPEPDDQKASRRWWHAVFLICDVLKMARCSQQPAYQVLEVAHGIYSKMGKWHDALRTALRINKREMVESTFAACKDPLEKKQLGYLLARHGFSIKLDEVNASLDHDDRGF